MIPEKDPQAVRLLRPSEIAEILNCSRSQAYRLMAKGDLRSVRFGSLVRCTPADLADFIEKARDSEEEHRMGA